MSPESPGVPAAARHDPDMNVAPAGAGLAWHDVSGLAVEGLGWPGQAELPWRRLPERARRAVPQAVWDLSAHTAGVTLRFAAEAAEISARWELVSGTLAMDHMPATGVSGLDLYARDGGAWRWLGVGRPTESRVNEKPLAGPLPPGRREYLLHFPLYNGLRRLELGLPRGSRLEPPPPRPAYRRRPVVFYGTSVVQGGCASRPGMAYPAILGRWLDRPTVNLGFSGSGRMEPEVAPLVAELDAAAFVIDCLPNVEEPLVTERLAPLVRTLRAAWPETPILLVENLVYANAWLVEPRRRRFEESNRALRRALEGLAAEGVRGLHRVPADGLLGADGEATVDGTHATDVGFLRIAAAVRPVLEAALAGK